MRSLSNNTQNQESIFKIVKIKANFIYTKDHDLKKLIEFEKESRKPVKAANLRGLFVEIVMNTNSFCRTT